MKTTMLALALLLGAAPAFAQQQAGSSSMRDQRAARQKELGKKNAKEEGKATTEADLWPGATRKAPDPPRPATHAAEGSVRRTERE